MSQRTNETRVKELVDAINRHDLTTVLEYLADNMIAWLSGFDEQVPKESMRECWHSWFAMFPDLSYHIERMISQDTTVIAEVTGRGTHRGDVLGIAATNKTVTTKGVWILDFEANKITHWQEYYNIPGYASAQLIQYLSAKR